MDRVSKRRRSRHASPLPAAPLLAAAEPRRVWQRHLWRLMVIWGLVFIAYSNSFHGALVFDSGSVIGEDPRIRAATPENIESILRGGYWYGGGERAANSGLYRPFTTLSYLVNYSVLGDGPRTTGHHAVNFVLHEVNVALVYHWAC